MTFSKKTISFSFTLFFCVTLSQYSLLAKESSSSLYGLIFCDTLSCDIKPSTTADVTRMKATISEISAITGLHEMTTVLDGASYSPFSLHQWILSTQPTVNDVVFCYFGCHGFRTVNQQTPWPRIFFPLQKASLDGNGILNAIVRWKPRLAIIIFECCNSVIWHRIKGKIPFSTSSLSPIGITKLFNEQHGIAVACSASPGERAFGIPERHDFPSGGIFTTSFLTLLSDESSLSHPSWGSLFERTSLMCQSTSYRLANTLQTPYISVITSSSK